MFTSQHYKKIATLFHEREKELWIEQVSDEYYACQSDMIEDFCEMFQKDNPRFAEDTFRSLCGQDV